MFEKLIPIINKASKIGMFVHTHPDGDAMGSAYGLSLALGGSGKKSRVFLPDSPDVPALSLVVSGDDESLEIEDCDLLIALDCADAERLGGFRAPFEAHPNTIAIDHHITHKPFASSGTVYTCISSTCELIYMLLDEMNIALTKDIATDLYIGLVTDTGNFKYSSISGDTLRAAAELVDTGIDHARLSRVLFTTKPMSYYYLMRTAIDNMRIISGGKTAVIYLSDEDLRRAGITEAEANGIVTIPGSIEGIEVGVYIRQRQDGEYKISLRSNEYVDVAEIAARFGGGGHVHASGYSVFDKTVDEIIDELERELSKSWPS